MKKYLKPEITSTIVISEGYLMAGSLGAKNQNHEKQPDQTWGAAGAKPIASWEFDDAAFVE